MGLPDFDKLFETYLKNWYRAHADDGMTPEELEDKLPEIYAEWAERPEALLSGETPAGYFAKIQDPGTLLALLIESGRTGEGACALLIDRMAEVEGTTVLLARAIEDGSIRGELLTETMNILVELSGKHPLKTYAAWLVEDGVDEGQRELAAEILTDHAAEAAPFLFPLIEAADDEQCELLAQVLAAAPKDERTYRLLERLFLSRRGLPLAASLIAKYGDERLVGVLYPALDDCNYMEFIEIRNAVEALGGTVDEDYRDFSDDAYYKLLKGL
ncbi:MAG: hypothetical protein LBH24_00610 [Clostridiales bacterium]|jgi:hypothetical protein|nr:hypothetical protein [Clostridiales bacterium]